MTPPDASVPSALDRIKEAARAEGDAAGYLRGFQDAREAAAKECETLKVKYEATRECAAAIRAITPERERP